VWKAIGEQKFKNCLKSYFWLGLGWLSFTQLAHSYSAQFDSARLSSTQLDSAQLSSSQLNSSQLNSTQFSSIQLNLAQFSSLSLTQLSPSWIDSAQLSIKPDLGSILTLRDRPSVKILLNYFGLGLIMFPKFFFSTKSMKKIDSSLYLNFKSHTKKKLKIDL